MMFLLALSHDLPYHVETQQQRRWVRAHTDDDLFIYLPREKGMVTGDAVVDWMPFLGDGYPEEWIETLNALEQVDFTHMILGHGEVAPKSHLTCFRNYLTDLIASVKQAAAEGATMTEMQTTVAEQLAPQYEQGMSKYPIGAIPGSYWADDRDRLPQGRSNALNLRGTKTRRKPS